MINRVVLVGRLTKDAEKRSTNSGKSVASFTVAVDKRNKQSDGPTADFFRVNCWEKLADFAGTYLKKGALVAIDGRLQTSKFTASDGTTRETVEIVADNIQSLSKLEAAPTATAGTEEEYDPFSDQ